MPLNTYSPNTAENTNILWQTLEQAHNRDFTANCTIIASSMHNLHLNTRYHLRACKYASTTRNGQNVEIIHKDAQFQIGNRTQTSNKTYNEKTQGMQTYKADGLALSVHIGVYSANTYGVSVTLTPAQTLFTVGVHTLTNVGAKVFLGLMRTKFTLGILIGALGIRTTIAKKHYRNIDTAITKYLSKKMKTKTQINQMMPELVYETLDQSDEYSIHPNIYSKVQRNEPNILQPPAGQRRIFLAEDETGQYARLQLL